MPAFAALTGSSARPRTIRTVTLLAALAISVVVGCTGPNPAPPGTATNTATNTASPASTGSPAGTTASTPPGTGTGTGSLTDSAGSGTTGSTSSSPATNTSSPAGDFGSDSFVPFRTTVPDSATGKRIGMIGLDQANPFSKLVSDSIKQQAEIAGAELIFCDAENNAEVALRCARRLASQGVDAWVTFQSVTSAGRSICEAGPKDVPMISIDSDQGSCQSARVGTDDQWAGFTTGVELGRYARQHFDCDYGAALYLVDPSRGFSDHRRQTGAELGLATSCSPIATHPVPQQLLASSQSAAFTAVGKALTSIDKDKRVLIIGTNDGLTLGAVGAAKAAGRLDNVYLASIGADPRSHCEITTDPHWVGDTASFPEKYGQLVIPYLVDLLDGKPVPQDLFVRNEFLDANVIAEHYDVSGCKAKP